MIEINNGTYWRTMTDLDITGLNIVKDEKNEMYLQGAIKFFSEDATWLMDLKDNQWKTQLSIRYNGKYESIISLQGITDFAMNKLELTIEKLDVYKLFENVMSEENRLTSEYKEFDFDSWLDTIYVTIGSKDLDIFDDYEECLTGPPDWVSGTLYRNANSLGSNEYYGREDAVVTHNNKIYFSLTNDNSETPSSSATYWAEFFPTGDTVTKSQERAYYDFPIPHLSTIDHGTYDDLSQYWWRKECTAGSYTSKAVAYNLQEQLHSLLLTQGYTLAVNYLAHAAAIDSEYNDNIWIVNEKMNDKITISEIIEHYKTLFNVEYRLVGTELTFKHVTEQVKPWISGLNTENDLSGYSINEYTEDMNNIGKHKLEFTQSTYTTNENSTLDYYNDFADDKIIKGNFDVDFRYAINKGGLNCPVLVDEFDKIVTANTAFIPSELHRLFYFDWREYDIAEFLGSTVGLRNGYFGSSTVDLPPSFVIENFDCSYEINLPYGVGRIKEIVFKITDNLYSLSLMKKM